MALKIACPACGAGLNLKEELAGRKVRCPRCQQPFVVPQQSAVVSDLAELPAEPAVPVSAVRAAAESVSRQKSPGSLLPGPPPEDVEGLRSRIQKSFLATSIQSVRVPGLYRLGILLVAVLMVLLPLVYILIIALTGVLVYRHAVENVSVITALSSETTGRNSVRAAAFGFMLYAAPLISGGMLLLFMLKPFFSRQPEHTGRRTLKRSDEPILFDFVGRICRAVNSPVPSRIDIDCQINASAGFSRGLLSFFGNDLVLTIGMPLVAGLTMRQFGGVLAHEFGHFSQGAGMRFSWLIRTMNYWFARLVYERDSWDEWLEDWSRRLDIRIGWVLLVARFTVWLVRRLLWVFMVVGNMISGFLMRQMEFDADRYEARFAGSRTFARTSRQLHVLGISWNGAMSDLSLLYQEERLVDNFPALILLNSEQMVERGQRAIDEEIIESRTSVFDTHPCDRERIASAAAEKTEGIFQLELPAAHLFRRFDEQSKAVTWDFYREMLGTELKKSQIHPVEKMARHLQEKQDTWKSLHRFFQGQLALYRPFRGPEEAQKPITNAAVVVDRLRKSREAMLAQVESFREAWKQFDECDTRMIEVRMAELLLRTEIRIPKDEFSVPMTTADEVSGVKVAAEDEQAKLLARLLPFEQAAAARLYSALRLAQSAELSGVLTEARFSAGEIVNLLTLFRQINDWIEQLLILRDTRLALGRMIHELESSEKNEKLVEQIKRFIGSMFRQLQGIQEAFADIPYPFDHARKQVSVADFLVESQPDEDDPGEMYEASDRLADRFMQLHTLVFGRLCQAAETVEGFFGMPLLPEPPESEEDDDDDE